MTRLTRAQRRALRRLPSDGSWREVTGDGPILVLHSLAQLNPPAVFGEFRVTPHVGTERVYRLTEAGMRLKAKMEDTP